MAYLFWSFAAVWVGIVAYLYALLRRTRALEREIEELVGRGSSAPAVLSEPRPPAGAEAMRK